MKASTQPARTLCNYLKYVLPAFAVSVSVVEDAGIRPGSTMGGCTHASKVSPMRDRRPFPRF